MLIISGCVSFGTDLFNHSKGLFFNRALDKLSECQYNMSFHVQSGRTFHGWMYQVKRRQIKKEGKKGGEKRRGKKMGGNRKKRKKKEEKKKKKKEKRRSHKTKGKKGEGRGEEDRMKNRKEKERKKSWDQVFNKRKYCVGTEPSALVYIGILVTSTNHRS